MVSVVILASVLGAIVGFSIYSSVTAIKMQRNSYKNIELKELKKEIGYLTEHISGFKSSIATIDSKLDLGMKDIRNQLNWIDDNEELKALICRQANNLSNQIGSKKKGKKYRK